MQINSAVKSLDFGTSVLSQIPARFLTEKVLVTFIEHTSSMDALGFFKDEGISITPAMALATVRKSSFNIRLIPRALVTKELIREALLVSKTHKLP